MGLHISSLSRLLFLLSLVIIGCGWFVSQNLQKYWDTSHWLILHINEFSSFAGIEFQQHCSNSQQMDQQLLFCNFPQLLRLILLCVPIFVLFMIGYKLQRRESDLLPIHIGKIGLSALLLSLLIGINHLLAWSQLKLDQRLILQQSHESMFGCIQSAQWISRSGFQAIRIKLKLNTGAVDVTLRVEQSHQHISHEDLLETLVDKCFIWHLQLKKPRNFANQLPFNYEMHLLQQGILARGKIQAVKNISGKDKPSLQLLLEKKITLEEALQQLQSSTSGQASDRYLFDKIQNSNVKTGPSQYWQRGLLTADQSAFTTSQWRLAKSTGTLHLLVVSGLHMALLVFFSFFVTKIVVGIIASTIGRTPHWPYLNVRWLSFVICTLVLGLGVSQIQLELSVIRSVTMVWLGLLVIYSGRYLNWSLTILILMALVSLIWPPIAIVTGFWYSFYSVIILLFFFQHRKGHALEGFILPPWLLFIGLMPLSLYWATPVGWHHILANLVAVPLMVMAILPLTLATYLLPVSFLETMLSSIDALFWNWLSWCDHLHWPRWVYMNPLQMIAWMVLVILGALGANRWLLTVILLVISILLSQQSSRSNTAVTVFDVGQGQSIWLAGGGYQMIIDTGQQFSEKFSIAQNIIRPALFKAGIRHIDQLIISHNDHDHAGDIASLYRSPLAVSQLTVGQPLTVEQVSASDIGSQPIWHSCHDNDHWHKVSAELGYRFLQGPAQLRKSDNNQSCVVQVDWFGKKILIPGDIDQVMERALVLKYGFQLASDVLVVAHHGSNSSSSLIWLKAVNPDHAIISAGYSNRYDHPHREVIDRLQFYNQQIKIWTTAEQGAITIDKSGRLSSVRL